MKLLQDSEHTKATRKSLKPQVERRRRERMNRSLESLKTLLLQKQEETERRVEKAEILEHTVLFLQKTVKGDTTGGGGGGGGGGGQKQSYQDGFSTCLQRAAQFLGPQGRGLWVGAALDASFASRFPRSHPQTPSPTSPLLLRKSSRSMLQLLMNRSGHRLCAQTATLSCVQNSGAEVHPSPSSPQQQQPPHRLVSQSLWRPWP
ncbi:transcription factor HES-5-like [Solea solea]|uniref:transcription factor HES-5-like n=1 Tax=Solea solea TaxID=90069 RepID=UPI00272B5861|nr:transcription factor HES-5-like [Solea solea]